MTPLAAGNPTQRWLTYSSTEVKANRMVMTWIKVMQR